MNHDAKLFARIAPLFDVGLLSDAQALIAGCGSGGSQVALQLAMSGIRRFALFDRDVLEAENVIRHACGGRYIGQRKVDALADVLLDRNPTIEIERHEADIMACPDLVEHVKRSAVVVLATPPKRRSPGAVAAFWSPLVIAGTMPTSYEGVYGATKAFDRSLSQSVREELMETGVTITTLMPGATET
jgi:predicted ThiF/HesA family dinucleotide-utilizing enzyme